MIPRRWVTPGPGAGHVQHLDFKLAATTRVLRVLVVVFSVGVVALLFRFRLCLRLLLHLLLIHLSPRILLPPFQVIPADEERCLFLFLLLLLLLLLLLRTILLSGGVRGGGGGGGDGDPGITRNTLDATTTSLAAVRPSELGTLLVHALHRQTTGRTAKPSEAHVHERVRIQHLARVVLFGEEGGGRKQAEVGSIREHIPGGIKKGISMIVSSHHHLDPPASMQHTLRIV